jgi:hypothetical protein
MAIAGRPLNVSCVGADASSPEERSDEWRRLAAQLHLVFLQSVGG